MHDQIAKQGATILVIGGSSQATATRIATTFRTPFPVLADPNRHAYRMYGFSKTALVIQQSGTVLIDRARRIRYLHCTTNPQTSLKRSELADALNSLSEPCPRKG